MEQFLPHPWTFSQVPLVPSLRARDMAEYDPFDADNIALRIITRRQTDNPYVIELNRRAGGSPPIVKPVDVSGALPAEFIGAIKRLEYLTGFMTALVLAITAPMEASEHLSGPFLARRDTYLRLLELAMPGDREALEDTRVAVVDEIERLQPIYISMLNNPAPGSAP